MRTSGVRFALMAIWVFAVSACSGPWGAAVKPQSAEALAAAAPVGRMSDAARPQAYRVALDIDPRAAGFSGRVEIDTRFQAPADGVWLHSDDITVKSVKLKVRGKETEAIWRDVLPTGVAWVQFPKRLNAKQATLIIDYDAKFDANLSGLFKVDENGDAYALAKSESIQARRFLPSFDERRSRFR
jgi:aminopeptidase N